MTANTSDTSDTSAPADRTERSLGTWITAAERMLSVERAAIFEREGLTGREWRLLDRLTTDTSGPVPRGPRLRHLAERGWIERTHGEWRLTKDGRDVRDRVRAARSGLEATLTDAIGPDELETTLDSLRNVALALGWDEGTPLPRRPHRSHRRSRTAPRGPWGGPSRHETMMRPGAAPIPPWAEAGGRWEANGGRADRWEADGWETPARSWAEPHQHRSGRPHRGHDHTPSDHFRSDHFRSGHLRSRHRGRDPRADFGPPVDGSSLRGPHPAGDPRRGHPHRIRVMRRVFERGFDAGFSRGRRSEKW